MAEEQETTEQYIKRMTGSKEIFTPTGWISVHAYRYRNKKMLFLECYTDCIHKKGQPIAKFWMSQTDAVHLSWLLLDRSNVWNNKKKKRNQD